MSVYAKGTVPNGGYVVGAIGAPSFGFQMSGIGALSSEDVKKLTEPDYPVGANGPAGPQNYLSEDFDYVYDEFGIVGAASKLKANGPRPGYEENQKYKYNENKYLKEISDYIEKTYGQHYSQNKYQATEFIIDSGHGTGFCIGNVLKYAQRYGRKGSREDWRKDLMKVIHYAIIQLHVHDEGTK